MAVGLVVPSAEELHKARVAVWLVVLLLERSLVELLEAERAHEVFRVELLEHGRHAAPGDRLQLNLHLFILVWPTSGTPAVGGLFVCE